MVAQATGTYRLSVFSLIVLFASGLYILLRVDVPRAIREAGQIVPASLRLKRRQRESVGSSLRLVSALTFLTFAFKT
ncbi:MAG: hypothetical protein U0559_08495 [Anaerolineae bacterium]